jgi:hypothetical protein
LSSLLLVAGLLLLGGGSRAQEEQRDPGKQNSYWSGQGPMEGAPLAYTAENEERRLRQKERQGDDRDAFGCIRSAGYRWCEKTGRCERPWALAEKQGFEKTPEAFKAWCDDVLLRKKEPTVGGD